MIRALFVLVVVLCGTSVPGQDLVLVGAKVWTGVRGAAEADAIWLRGDRIAAVGTAAEVLARAPGTARRIDVDGRRILPGLIDAHVHFLGGGEDLLAPDLRSADSADEMARRLGVAAAEVPAGTWLTGGTWDHESWPGAPLPTRADLDRHVPDHPVFVQRLDGHMAVANSLAIRLAGVTAKTPDLPGGEIVRDVETGEPAGVFKDTAMVLIQRRVPAWTREQRLRFARAGLRRAAELGVTGVHDMLYEFGALATWQELRRRGELSLRVTVYTPIESLERWRAVQVGRGFGDAWLKLGGVKGFADGSLGSSTAWFFEPYADRPDTAGLAMPALLPGGAMEEDVGRCFGADLQTAIHAIGDRANRSMLDIFARAGAGGEFATVRPRIEHAQHLHPDDIPRFAGLGVIASMQPYHAADDGRWADKRIGATRCQTTYAFRSLLDAGAVLAFGSDWPVAPLSPWLGIEAAVTRQTLDGAHPDGWVPEQRIRVEEALRAYTSGAAFAAFDEADVGTLEGGKRADLIVLDRDVLAVEPAEIGATRVLLTVVGGRVVHDRLR